MPTPSSFRPKAVLFDLDGVIIDSERFYTSIWETINDKFPTGEKDFVLKIKGSTLTEILERYFSAEDRPLVEKLLYEMEDKLVYKYCPGAEKALSMLRDNGIPIAMVTSSQAYKMNNLRNDLPELEGKFDAIVTGDMVEKSKPDPECYLLAASMLDIAPEDCLVVEDSLQGIEAGKRASMKVAAVAGTLPASELKRYCHFICDSLEEFPGNYIIIERE